MAYMNIYGYASNTYTSPYGSVRPTYGHTQDSQTLPCLGIDKEKGNNAVGNFGIKDPSEECQTCKNRKYQDGSDEHNVSFKAAAHIDPNAAASAVRAHENQHVSNAYKKAEMKDGKVLRASVTIQTSICPECGRSYVSGGTTNTQIKYYNEENPYQKDLKATDGVKYTGMNVDMIA